MESGFFLIFHWRNYFIVGEVKQRQSQFRQYVLTENKITIKDEESLFEQTPQHRLFLSMFLEQNIGVKVTYSVTIP